MQLIHANPDHMYVKTPKKIDDKFICKVGLTIDNIKHKCAFTTPVTVKKIKTGATSKVLYLKLGNRECQSLLAIEEHILHIITENVGTWFNHRIKSSSIDDMFVPMIIVDRTHGSLLKVKVDEHLSGVFDDIQINKKYFVNLQIDGICFSKHKCVVMFDISSFTSPDTVCMFDDDASGDDIAYMATDDEADIGPTIDEVYTIKEHLLLRCKHLMLDLQNKHIQVQGFLNELQTCQNSLMSYDLPSLKLLDDIAKTLGNCEQHN